jgi:hypothetical protein
MFEELGNCLRAASSRVNALLLSGFVEPIVREMHNLRAVQSTSVKERVFFQAKLGVARPLIASKGTSLQVSLEGFAALCARDFFVEYFLVN